MESIERTMLQDNDLTIAFEESLPAYLISRAFIKTFANLLDFSSVVGPDSYIEQTLINKSPTLVAQTRILGDLTRNQPLLMKDETNGCAMKSIITAATKQNMILTFPKLDSFPFANSDAKVLSKKIKGLNRSHHKFVEYDDFISCVLHKQAAKTIGTARLQRCSYRIFLAKSSRKCLGRFTSKRFLHSRFRRNSSFHSFPLNWKGRIVQLLFC